MTRARPAMQHVVVLSGPFTGMSPVRFLEHEHVQTLTVNPLLHVIPTRGRKSTAVPAAACESFPFQFPILSNVDFLWQFLR